MKKVNWGIVSTAKIGTKKVIPAMQKGKYSHITAIASRDIEKAQRAAQKLNITKAYGSYRQLLDDPEIEAVYIPLPNHMHVKWTIKALEAGKHVLCEKPVAINVKDAEYLYQKVKDFPHLKVMEAFMYRFHPQWQTVKKLVNEGKIGELRNIHSIFSYYNDDKDDIRNQKEIGGGGLLDIGCYCISLSRFLFNAEPKQVCSIIEYDPQLKIDRLTTGMLEFQHGHSAFTCSTQLIDHQKVDIFGTQGKIEIKKPFTPSPEKPSKVKYQTGSQIKEIEFEACNHYTIQGDLFSQAILNNTAVPTPLEDGVKNMRVIDKIVESSRMGAWVKLK
ncbi:MAG: Gfo/Idh/MocA family oxidoreductase [bacterium]